MNYNYDPVSVVPMIKIIASDVVIDFNNIGITNISNLSGALVAVEIGWSPEELIADATRIQPKNITIKKVKFRYWYFVRDF